MAKRENETYLWVGSALREDKGNVYYTALSVTKKIGNKTKIYRVGDHVYFRSDNANKPYIAEIENFYESKSSHEKYVTARWFYRSSDVLAFSSDILNGITYDSKNEVFYSEYKDVNLVWSIYRPCTVVIVPVKETRSAVMGGDVYICRYEFGVKGDGKPFLTRIKLDNSKSKTVLPPEPLSDSSSASCFEDAFGVKTRAAVAYSAPELIAGLPDRLSERKKGSKGTKSGSKAENPVEIVPASKEKSDASEDPGHLQESSSECSSQADKEKPSSDTVNNSSKGAVQPLSLSHCTGDKCGTVKVRAPKKRKAGNAIGSTKSDVASIPEMGSNDHWEDEAMANNTDNSVIHDIPVDTDSLRHEPPCEELMSVVNIDGNDQTVIDNMDAPGTVEDPSEMPSIVNETARNFSELGDSQASSESDTNILLLSSSSVKRKRSLKTKRDAGISKRKKNVLTTDSIDTTTNSYLNSATAIEEKGCIEGVTSKIDDSSVAFNCTPADPVTMWPNRVSDMKVPSVEFGNDLEMLSSVIITEADLAEPRVGNGTFTCAPSTVLQSADGLLPGPIHEDAATDTQLALNLTVPDTSFMSPAVAVGIVQPRKADVDSSADDVKGTPAATSVSLAQSKGARPSRNLINPNSYQNDTDPYVYPANVNRSKVAPCEEFLHINSKSGIRVGDNYQAEIPSLSDCLCFSQDDSDNSLSKREELADQYCAWKPDRISPVALRKYLHAATATIEAYKRSLSMETADRDDEVMEPVAANDSSLSDEANDATRSEPNGNASHTTKMESERYKPVVNGALVVVRSEASSLVYDILHECSYDADAALVLLQQRVGSMVRQWSIAQQQRFQTAFTKYGDNLRKIQQRCTGLDPRDVMEYYIRFVYAAVQLENVDLKIRSSAKKYANIIVDGGGGGGGSSDSGGRNHSHNSSDSTNRDNGNAGQGTGPADSAATAGGTAGGTSGGASVRSAFNTSSAMSETETAQQHSKNYGLGNGDGHSESSLGSHRSGRSLSSKTTHSTSASEGRHRCGQAGGAKKPTAGRIDGSNVRKTARGTASASASAAKMTNCLFLFLIKARSCLDDFAFGQILNSLNLYQQKLLSPAQLTIRVRMIIQCAMTLEDEDNERWKQCAIPDDHTAAPWGKETAYMGCPTSGTPCQSTVTATTAAAAAAAPVVSVVQQAQAERGSALQSLFDNFLSFFPHVLRTAMSASATA